MIYRFIFVSLKLSLTQILLRFSNDCLLKKKRNIKEDGKCSRKNYYISFYEKNWLVSTVCPQINYGSITD